jgi:hypothetical protein
MVALDSAIIEEYTNFAIPADHIVAEPHVAAAFRDDVNRRLLVDVQLDQSMLNKRLLNLRRRGQEKGGLPRLERLGCKSEWPSVRS